MTVYVLIENWQIDSAECGQDVRFFETIEDAIKVFEEKIKNAKIDFDDLETEENDYCEGDMSWSIWEEENYECNHIDLQILEREIENF